MTESRLSDRVRHLETLETVICEVGKGPPDHRSYPVTLYFDYENQELYACVGRGGGTRTWKKLT